MVELPTRRARSRRRAAANTVATVVCAPAVFAPTSFARLRLIRQMHACGLLSGEPPAVGEGHGAALGPARRELSDGSAPSSC